jgi:hypothetical protein
MLIIYFDTQDAFLRTSRYNSKGKVGLFVEKIFSKIELLRSLKKLQGEYSKL